MKAKKKECFFCPDCDEALVWVELGEPEGDFFTCQNCSQSFDEDGEELK